MTVASDRAHNDALPEAAFTAINNKYMCIHEHGRHRATRKTTSFFLGRSSLSLLALFSASALLFLIFSINSWHSESVKEEEEERLLQWRKAPLRQQLMEEEGRGRRARRRSWLPTPTISMCLAPAISPPLTGGTSFAPAGTHLSFSHSLSFSLSLWWFLLGVPEMHSWWFLLVLEMYSWVGFRVVLGCSFLPAFYPPISFSSMFVSLILTVEHQIKRETIEQFTG